MNGVGAGPGASGNELPAGGLGSLPPEVLSALLKLLGGRDAEQPVPALAWPPPVPGPSQRELRLAAGLEGIEQEKRKARERGAAMEMNVQDVVQAWDVLSRGGFGS